MYQVSNAYKNFIKNNLERNYKVRLTVGDMTINENDIFSYTLETNQPSDKYTIGNAISQMLKIEIANQERPFYNNQLYLEIGMLVNGAYEYIPVGYFNVDKSERKDNKTTLTCYDNMYKLEGLYICNLGSTKTMKNILDDISAKTSIQTGTFDYKNYVISDDIAGYSYREVIAMLAGLNGGNAYIDRTGKIKFVYLSDRTIKWSINDYYLFDGNSFKEQSYTIDKVTCYKDKDTSWSNGTLGTTPVEIQYENPFISEAIAKDIYNKLKGILYQAFNMETMSFIALDVGDWISYTSQDNTVYSLSIQHYKFMGGVKQTLESKAENNDNNFNANGSLTQKVNRTITELLAAKKAIIDKANISDLTADKIKFNIAEGKSASIQNLLSQFISGDLGQFMHFTGSNVVIDDAVIKDAMIDSIKASKITSGTIDANKVTLLAEKDGYKMIQTGRLIQFWDERDKTNAPIVVAQIGFDASNNFTFSIMDKEGKYTIYDATGITKNAVPDGLIVNDMVADNANIDAKKIDIESLIEEVNSNTSKTIKGSKVVLDSTGQNAEVSFKEMNTHITGNNLLSMDDYNIDQLYSYIGKSGFGFLLEPQENVIKPVYNTINVQLEGGKTYTLSANVSINYNEGETAEENREIQFNIDFADSSFPKTTSKARIVNSVFYDDRVTFTFTVPGNDVIATKIRVYRTDIKTETSKGNVIFREIKLEEGSEATPIIDGVESINEKYNALQSNVIMHNNEISTLVKETTIENGAGGVISLKDDYSQFKQTQDSINFSVSSSVTEQRNKIGSIADKNINICGEVSQLGHMNLKIFSDEYVKDVKYFRIKTCKADGSDNDGVTRVDAYGWIPDIPIAQGCKYTISLKLFSESTNKYYKIWWNNGTLFEGNTTGTRDNPQIIQTNFNIPSNFATDRITLYIGVDSASNDMDAYVGDIEIFCATTVIERVTNSEASIKLLEDSIDLKVSKSEVESLVGNTLASSVVEYYVSTSNTTVSGGSWSPNTPAWTSGKYIWSRTKTTLKNGTVSYSNPTCIQGATGAKGDAGAKGDKGDTGSTGATGKGIKSVVIQYYLSTSNTTQTGGSWSNTAPAWINGRFMWTRQAVTYTDNSVLYTTPCVDTAWKSLESRIATAEQKLEPGKITQSITDAINNGKVTATTVNTTLDKNGFTVKNGAITVQNKAGTDVIKGDTNGNLTMRGILEQCDATTGYVAACMKYNGFSVYDWRNNGDMTGGFASVYKSSNGRAGSQLFCDKDSFLALGYRKTGDTNDFTNSTFSNSIVIDYEKVGANDIVAFNDDVGFYGHSAISLYGDDSGLPRGYFCISTDGNVWLNASGPANNHFYIGTTNGNNGFTSNARLDQSSAYFAGDINCGGSKNRVVKTESYGWIAQNAYETADCYFGDIMQAETDDSGICVIYFDDKFLETVNTKCKYHVFCSAYGEDDEIFTSVKCIKREQFYFIIKSSVPNSKFSVEVKCKQKDYETERLVSKDIPDTNIHVNYNIEKEISKNQVIDNGEVDSKIHDLNKEQEEKNKELDNSLEDNLVENLLDDLLN